MAFYLRCTAWHLAWHPAWLRVAFHAHGVVLGFDLMSSWSNLIDALVCDYDASLLSCHVHFGYILNSRVI